MALPFTAEQFFGLFRTYNETVWPAQWALLALALVAIYLATCPSSGSSRTISAILGALWLWLGLAYHLAFFASINPLAYAFSAISVAGGLVFFWLGVVRQGLCFRLSLRSRGLMGLFLVVFSLVLYPVWSSQAGHPYPELPTFGLPCPTTIFTLGMLAFLAPPYPRAALVVLILWCLVGVQAAFLLDVPQDLGLLVAAATGVFLLVKNPTVASQGDQASDISRS